MGSYMYVYKGDDKTWTLNIKNSSGSAVDITGWTIFFTAKTNKTDTDDNAIIKKEVSTHTNPTQGISSLTLTNSDTNVTAKTYWYDIQAVDGSNNVHTFGVGQFEVKQDVTTRVS